MALAMKQRSREVKGEEAQASHTEERLVGGSVVAAQPVHERPRLGW